MINQNTIEKAILIMEGTDRSAKMQLLLEAMENPDCRAAWREYYYQRGELLSDQEVLKKLRGHIGIECRSAGDHDFLAAVRDPVKRTAVVDYMTAHNLL